MSYMEYKEVSVPGEIQERLEQLVQSAAPGVPATLGAAGVFEWMNTESREGGWRVVWPGFNFPFVVFEREVVEEEVKN